MDYLHGVVNWINAYDPLYAHQSPHDTASPHQQQGSHTICLWQGILHSTTNHSPKVLLQSKTQCHHSHRHPCTCHSSTSIQNLSDVPAPSPTDAANSTMIPPITYCKWFRNLWSMKSWHSVQQIAPQSKLSVLHQHKKCLHVSHRRETHHDHLWHWGTQIMHQWKRPSPSRPSHTMQVKQESGGSKWRIQQCKACHTTSSPASLMKGT